MKPIQIQLISGPAGGKQTTYTDSPVTFGRAAENDVVIDHPSASRLHGELRFEEDAWHLVNQSANGTHVNRRHVTKRPQQLREGDVIKVGDQPMFEVSFVPPAAPAADAEADEQATAVAPSISGRMKLWIGIGIYMFAMLALIVFGLTLGEDKSQSITTASELTDAFIAREIKRPLSVGQGDERLAREKLAEANTLFNRIDPEPSRIYRAHQAYKLSLAYSGQPAFERGIDDLQFQDVERRLIEDVTKRYKNAYAMLNSGQFAEAQAAFKELTDRFPDYQSELYQNIQAHWTAAGRAQGRR